MQFGHCTLGDFADRALPDMLLFCSGWSVVTLGSNDVTFSAGSSIRTVEEVIGFHDCK